MCFCPRLLNLNPFGVPADGGKDPVAGPESCYGERVNVTAHPGRVLIVGCGNPDAGDDSAGLEVVRRLGELGDCGCDLRAESAPGVQLLEVLPLAEVILFVDAVTSGAPPGTLYFTSLPSKELESKALGSLSSHGWGLAEVLTLAQTLGRRIPRLFLLGIEAGTVAQGDSRSAAVEQAITLVVEKMSDLRSVLLTSEGLELRSFFPGDQSFPGFGVESGAMCG